MKESREVPSDEIDINPDKQKRKSSNTSSSLKKKRKILEKNFKSSFTYSKPNINTNKNLKINNNAIMNKNILINNNISNAANSASNTNNYNLIKTLQLQIDRLFLSACEGIVDADMSHLFRYINAGGDLTRYLTSDEVCLLKIIFFCLRLDRKSLRA